MNTPQYSSLDAYNQYSVTVTVNPGQQLQYVFITFETWPSPAYSCKIGIELNSGVYLHDDQGNAFPTMPFGQPGQQGNTKCSLDAGGSPTPTQNGQQITVSFSLKHNTPYSAPVSAYVTAYQDAYNYTPWLFESYVRFTGAQAYLPNTVSVTGASGVSRQNDIQIFSVKVSSTDGALAIWHVEFLFGQGASWANGYDFQPNNRCKVVSESGANLVWLESGPDVNQQEPPGYVNVGNTQPIANGRCTLYPQYTSVELLNENTMVVNFAVSFQAFTGILQDHIFVADNGGGSRWDKIPALGGSDAQWSWYSWPNANPPQPPAAFVNCITLSSVSCNLQPFNDGAGNLVPYMVSSTLRASGSNTYISASGGVLQRDPNFSNGNLLEITGQSATFQNLFIDGNRNGFGSATNASTLNSRCLSCSDLAVLDPASNISVNGKFLNAPWQSVSVGTNNPQATVRRVTIQGSDIENSHQTGILIYGVGTNGQTPVGPYFDYRACPADSTGATGLPQYINIYNNVFRNNSTGALSFNEVYFGYVSANQFYDNQLDPDATNRTGGLFSCLLAPCMSA